MPLGPVEILCIKFPSTFIKDEIASALRTLVENQTIRIIDILFIRKNEAGAITINEVDEVGDIDYSIFDPLISNISGLISEDDVQEVAQSLDNNSFAALMLFENTWATAFRDAIVNANGQLLMNERIPSHVIEEVMATQV
ncbi:DUF6325 family protein (plasmid) [Kovacikia minuta CCNUW1]|uniref:DUF6325 family protein n=1 Tax=Kovacikia minuta TaxID=2931930 RepID=UPI001CC9E506|nr:DUF6325 family protein [Kovacikia minuta]UBF30021.1 DUF6325 family protein [Kovacikia minuta CCNUW1]